MDIEGHLVRLRALREEDAPRIAEILSDPRVSAHLDHWARTPYTLAAARDFVSQPCSVNSDVRWAIECHRDGAFIGATGLHGIDHHNRRATFGIWIGPPQRWGKGYGTEACRLAVHHGFRHLGLTKVQLCVYAGNDAGRRAYVKAGFQSEGILRRHQWIDGDLVDVETMAVFADDPLYT
ncbi:MAG: GNAT family N-acetyltransferase [Candidatus Dormibacteria bacterium]